MNAPRGLSRAQWAALALGPGVLVVVLAAVAIAGRPAGEVLRDPLSVVDAPAHIGLLSTLGALLWAVAAGCCATAAGVLARRSPASRDHHYLRAAAWLTVALGVDDAFMIHDEVLYRVFGLRQVVVMLAWAAAGAWFVRFHRDLLAPGRAAAAGLALGLFGVSYGFDGLEGLLGWEPIGWHLVLEDGAKFLGIVAWLLFHWQVAIHALAGSDEDARQGSGLRHAPERPDDEPGERRLEAKAGPRSLRSYRAASRSRRACVDGVTCPSAGPTPQATCAAGS